MKKSKKYYDSKIDTLWVVFKEGEEDRYEEITPGIKVEYNKDSEIIGLEINAYSKFFSGSPMKSEAGNRYTATKFQRKPIISNYRF